MNSAQMEAMAQEFVAAARLAKEAGFDAVELHMGHGYLLSQFISPLYNKRRDAYGGSIEKRMEFPAQVLRQVLDAVGKDLAVIVKYSMTDGPKGNRIKDGIGIARRLQAEGAHMAVLSNGMNVDSIEAMFGSSLPKTGAKPANPVIRLGMWVQSLSAPPEVQFRENYLRDLSRKVRAAVPDLPLAYLGGVTSRQGAAQAMADGFEAIGMGRALVHDPQFINDLHSGAVQSSGCNACNRCVTMMYSPGGTACVLSGNQMDPELNKVAAGAGAGVEA